MHNLAFRNHNYNNSLASQQPERLN